MKKGMGNAGIGMIGLVVELGVTSVLMMASVKLLTDNIRSVGYFQGASSFQQIVTTLGEVVANNNACQSAFTAYDHDGDAHPLNYSGNPVTLNSIRWGNEVVVSQSQQLEGGLRISALKLQPIAGATPYAMQNVTVYPSELVVEGQRQGGSFGPNSISAL